MLFDRLTIIDLTHSLCSNVPTWDNSCGFQVKAEHDNDQIIIHSSTGTHIDAPALFFEKLSTIGSLPLTQLLVPACLIDVSKKANATYEISPEDIKEYEALYGSIPKNSLVIGYTGWSRHWPDAKAYRNADTNGHLHFPTFGVQTVQMLVSKDIAGIAIDTLALESLSSSFPGHKLLLGAGKYIIENIANCSKLPPKGAYVIALPLKIPECSEAPARVIGLIPKIE